jgi:integrase/recombinase XerD
MPLPPTAFQRLPRYFTQAEVKAFLRAIRTLRDQTLFALIYHYGLRVSEVALLERGDVDLARGRLIVKRVKGGVWTERPLFSTSGSLLRTYLERSGGEELAPLFPGNGGPLKKRQIQALFVRYRDRAGLDRRYTAHCLRHSIATHLLEAGLPLEFVQDHLGHRHIRSTTIYARITDRYRLAKYRALEKSPWIVHPDGPRQENTPSSEEGIL